MKNGRSPLPYPEFRKRNRGSLVSLSRLPHLPPAPGANGLFSGKPGALASDSGGRVRDAPAPKPLQREVNRSPMGVHWYTDGQPHSIGIPVVPVDQPVAS